MTKIIKTQSYAESNISDDMLVAEHIDMGYLMESIFSITFSRSLSIFISPKKSSLFISLHSSSISPFQNAPAISFSVKSGGMTNR
jgi:hypothetical protein